MRSRELVGIGARDTRRMPRKARPRAREEHVTRKPRGHSRAIHNPNSRLSTHFFRLGISERVRVQYTYVYNLRARARSMHT